MPKKIKKLPDQLNFLAPVDTRDKLVAIAFYRGQAGKYAKPAQDFIVEGIERFLAALSPKERGVFDEILQTVKTSESYRKEVRRG